MGEPNGPDGANSRYCSRGLGASGLFEQREFLEFDLAKRVPVAHGDVVR